MKKITMLWIAVGAGIVSTALYSVAMKHGAWNLLNLVPWIIVVYTQIGNDETTK